MIDKEVWIGIGVGTLVAVIGIITAKGICWIKSKKISGVNNDNTSPRDQNRSISTEEKIEGHKATLTKIEGKKSSQPTLFKFSYSKLVNEDNNRETIYFDNPRGECSNLGRNNHDYEEINDYAEIEPIPLTGLG